MKTGTVRFEIEVNLDWDRGNFVSDKETLEHYDDQLYRLISAWGGVNSHRFRPSGYRVKLLETPHGVKDDGKI